MVAKAKQRPDEVWLRITLVKSPIGYREKQRRTVVALGLRRMQASVTHRATPQIRGMIAGVRHLLRVEEVGE